MIIEKDLIIIAVGLIGLVALHFFSRSNKRKRTREILALTPTNYDFNSEDNGVVSDIFRAFRSSQLGRNISFLNVVQNPHIMLFEFHFITGRRTSNCINVVVMPAIGVPDFILRPEGYLDKVFSLIGYQDIDFENYPDFSSSYVLQGEDETSVRWFFEESALSYFYRAHGHLIEVKNGHAALMYHGVRSPKKYIELLSRSQQVWSTIV